MQAVLLSVYNTDGRWQTTDQNWYDLESAGWIIQWCTLYPRHADKLVNGRIFGSLAIGAILPNASIEQAKTEFESITNLNPNDPGCKCCGQPFVFNIRRLVRE